MRYEVQLAEDAEIFINSLEVKLKAKAFRTIELLSEFGPFLSEPHSKKIAGTQSLFELRVKQGSNIARFFYFNQNGKIFIITSGYVKKENKLKRSEIDKALKIMNIILGDKHEKL